MDMEKVINGLVTYWETDVGYEYLVVGGDCDLDVEELAVGLPYVKEVMVGLGGVLVRVMLFVNEESRRNYVG